MKINGEYVLREIAGDHILIPVGNAAMRINGMITLDEMGVFIWKAIECDLDEEAILQRIIDTYDVEEIVAREDLEEFLDTLEKDGLIEKTD